jgi:hypothetical protein
VFEGVRPELIAFQLPKNEPPPAVLESEVELAGPWGFYHKFWRAHDLDSRRFLRPEIAVRPNDTLTIPLLARNNSSQPERLTAKVALPAGWRMEGDNRQMTVPHEGEVTRWARRRRQLLRLAIFEDFVAISRNFRESNPLV